MFCYLRSVTVGGVQTPSGSASGPSTLRDMHAGATDSASAKPSAEPPREPGADAACARRAAGLLGALPTLFSTVLCNTGPSAHVLVAIDNIQNPQKSRQQRSYTP